MASIEITKSIYAPAQIVFEALTHSHLLKQWFTADLIAFPKEHTTAAFAIGDIDFKMLLEVMEPPNRLCWRCVDGNVNWVGNTFEFLLEDKTTHTVLSFTQSDLNEDEKVGLWAASWDNYLFQLKELCEKLYQN